MEVNFQVLLIRVYLYLLSLHNSNLKCANNVLIPLSPCTRRKTFYSVKFITRVSRPVLTFDRDICCSIFSKYLQYSWVCVPFQS